MPYRKILVAYDGSKASDAALEQAIMLADGNDATMLEIVHVYNMPIIVLGEAVFTPPPGYEKDIIAHSGDVVLRAKNLLGNTRHSIVTMLKGNPAKAILEYADETQCDLIVIGSRGHSGIKEFMLGSVSHNVVLHAKVPVLLVK